MYSGCKNKHPCYDADTINIYKYLYGKIESIMEISVPIRKDLRLNILGDIRMHLFKEIIYKYRKKT